MSGTSSTVVRAELADLIGRELLGPRDGHQEELQGSPRAAYAVGGLAPVTVDPSLPLQDFLPSASDDQAFGTRTGTSVVSEVNSERLDQRGVPVPSDEDVSSAEADERED